MTSHDLPPQVLGNFPDERDVLTRERASDAYAISSWYLAKLLAELPLSWPLPAGFFALAYPLGDLPLASAPGAPAARGPSAAAPQLASPPPPPAAPPPPPPRLALCASRRREEAALVSG